MKTDFEGAGGADRLYRALVETSTDVISLIHVDGRIGYINVACRGVLGYDPDEMWGRHIHQFVAPHEHAGLDTVFERIMDGEARFGRRLTAVRKDGSEVHLMLNASPLLTAEGTVAGVVTIATDVTEMAETEERLRAAEERYRTLVEQLPAVSYIAEPGPDGAWRYVSPQLKRILGFSQDEWMADPSMWARHIHPDDRERVIDEESRDTTLGVPLASEYRMITKDGRVVWIRDEGVLRAGPDERLHYEGMLTNVTERKTFENQLQFLADHDPLTGVFNRRRFVEELGLEIKLMRRDGHPSSLLLIDLDSLKQVNDRLGHQAGDALVRETSELLRERLRETDAIGRLGGDEFAVLLRGSRVNEAAAVAQDLLERFRGRHQTVAGELLGATVSVGLTSLRRNFAGAEEAVAAADRAMYEAKRTGGDRVAMYTRRLPRLAASADSSAEQIQRALDEDRLRLYEQPIVEISSRHIHQHELLLRLQAEDGALVPPDGFLPAAERFDLVQAMDTWTALRAIRLLEELGRDGEAPRLEVNVSAKSIEGPGLLDAIGEALRRAEVNPGQLILETNEKVAVADLRRAREFSLRVHDMGCEFALDNFGSGFGSFFYLKHLPVDYVKIGGDFTGALTASGFDRRVVKAIVDVAGALGGKTVGEKVNDERTMEILGDLGVDYAQGFHVGTPSPVEELGDSRGSDF